MNGIHTPLFWKVEASRPILRMKIGRYLLMIGDTKRLNDSASKDLALIASAAKLLMLAHCYADECGECGGTRVMPDGEPCDECAFIWAVIDKAEGRA